MRRTILTVVVAVAMAVAGFAVPVVVMSLLIGQGAPVWMATLVGIGIGLLSGTALGKLAGLIVVAIWEEERWR